VHACIIVNINFFSFSFSDYSKLRVLRDIIDIIVTAERDFAGSTVVMSTINRSYLFNIKVRIS